MNLFNEINPIDIHIHAGPSVANRKVDAYDMLLLSREQGYSAFITKDHYFPTVMATNLISAHQPDADIKVFGCLCLNNSVGGLNVYAVDAACAMGAKIVFFPTFSSKSHIEFHKKLEFTGSGKLVLHEKPIYYLEENGELNASAREVLEFIAQYYPDVAVGTGHGSPEEVDALVKYATGLGIKHILVNHPFYICGASINDMVRWAELGAFIELNAVVFDDVVPAAHHLPVRIAMDVLDAVGFERIIVDSDLGQKSYIDPADGLLKFAKVLMEKCNVSQEQLKIMMHDNPAKLIGA